jgi:hypothetical protein
MKLRISLAVAVVVILAGCATPRTFYQPERTTFSRPEVGVVVAANLGEALLDQGENREYDSVYLANTIGTNLATVQPAYYPKAYEYSTAEIFLPSESASRDTRNTGDRILEILVWKDPAAKTPMVIKTQNGLVAGAEGFRPERRKMVVASTGGFQQTLVYSGRVGNKLNIVYRESFDGRARPAFDNHVEYDLAESQVIGYKGAQLEVLEATNQHIKYKVLKNFDELRP